MGKDLTKQRTIDRQMQVWRQRCQGLPPWQLAERVGVIQQAVSKPLGRLARRFQPGEELPAAATPPAFEVVGLR